MNSAQASLLDAARELISAATAPNLREMFMSMATAESELKEAKLNFTRCMRAGAPCGEIPASQLASLLPK